MSVTIASTTCAVKPPNLPRPKDISVNGARIDRDAIARETQNHPATKPVDAWLAAARALIVRELLLQEARRLGIEAVPAEDDDGRRETDEEAQLRGLVEREIATPAARPEECQRFYEQNQQRFRSADIYEARHILCAADPADHAARKIARDRASAALAQLSQQPESFAELAAALSACPSGKAGGNLGQITQGQTVPEFEAALARMTPGEFGAHPIETRYGFHVVLLERRIEGELVPFEQVQSRIAEWLEEKVRRTAIRQYIAGLGERAHIEGIALDGTVSGPLAR